MKMNVNLDTNINNLLYLDYMEKQQQAKDTESNEEQKASWYKQAAPQDKKEK